MADCKHEHGGFLEHWWICGQCYRKLPERPRRFKMVKLDPEVKFCGAEPDRILYRQEITWISEEKVSAELTALGQFLCWIAERFKSRGGVGVEDANSLALDCLREIGIEFGDPSMMWNVAAAHDLADEEMDYWGNDEQSGGANG